MKIIDDALLAIIRRLPCCEFCNRPLRTGFEACHVLSRGRRSEQRLDVPFGVGAGCPVFSGNGCHRRSHDTGEGVEAFIANIAKRCKITPETLMDALKFLKWVPRKPLAGIVSKRFAELEPETQKLVKPYVEEML